MKFGLFYELQLPKPYDQATWDPEAEHRIYKEALQQIELADRLGFDYVFEVEHHFLEEYSHSSAPEIVLAAASQRTKTIRLCHGIVIMPPRFNHPARVAERIGALDLVSDGRAEFGTGESSSEMELGGFGVPREEKKAQWEEATREALRLMSSEPYPGYEGEFFGMPPRNVVPKPLQKPHPPVWVAASRRETVLVAARLGIGSLGFSFETPDEAAERVQTYFELIREECYPIGQAINPAIAVLSSFMCAPTDEQAVQRARAGAPFFSFALSHYYGGSAADPHQPGGRNLWREYADTPAREHLRRLEQQGRYRGQLGGSESPEEAGEKEPEDENARALWRAARRGGTIGSPDYIRKNLRKYEDAHLDAMILVAQAGDRRHEDIMASIELFAREVMPEFKERHPQHQEWRRRQLEGVPFPVNSSI
jgi:alkanesulfonate monooxygenase SsuD/methylene tetrahydromethanopterin reductase-like flavin-dependent oxidoreductase (luciferase family)